MFSRIHEQQQPNDMGELPKLAQNQQHNGDIQFNVISVLCRLFVSAVSFRRLVSAAYWQ